MRFDNREAEQQEIFRVSSEAVPMGCSVNQGMMCNALCRQHRCPSTMQRQDFRKIGTRFMLSALLA
jgi:hypothetical protein